jgi:hypothetical protein
MTVIRGFLYRPLKKTARATRQKQAKKRSLCVIDKYFEPVFNTVAATQIVSQQPVKAGKRVVNSLSG